MQYQFKGSIISYKNYKIPFQLNDGHLRLDVSSMPSGEVNYFDVSRKTLLGDVTLFDQEFLEGKTDGGFVIKIHVDSYYDRDQYFKPINYIYANVSSCVVLESDIQVDKIGFYSFDISKITGCLLSGAFKEEHLKMFGYDGSMAEYSENGHKYYVSYDFLNKKPYVSNQVIAFKSNGSLSQTMMEDIYWTARKFLAFIYQRKEVPIIDIALFNNDSIIGHLFVRKHLDENRILFGVKCLWVDSWNEKLSNLFQALVDKKIYLRHLPSFEKEKHDYTASRFLMTIVGFESTLNICQIKANYSNKHKEAIQKVRDDLNKSVETSTGEVKKEYKRLLKSLKDERFEDKVVAAIIDNIDYISSFYPLSIIGNSASAIAEKMSKSRNSFAHGDLDEDLSVEHANQCNFLDLFILYLQLRYIGFTEEEASGIVPQILFEH